VPEVDYQRRFVRLALRYLPHRLAVGAAIKLHASWALGWLNRWAARRYVGPVQLLAFSDSEIADYQRVTQSARYWHGTGRLQHSAGQPADVLESIVAHGLRAVDDAYAVYAGGEVMKSISLTKWRIIARSYADTFGKAYREPHRYGDALMWTAYYYGRFFAGLYLSGYHPRSSHHRRWHKLTHDENGENTWGKKSNRRAHDVWDIFGLGSDIPGNYPILIGLSTVPDPTKLPPKFDRYEVRTGSDLPVDVFTHLEVPADRVEEVQALLDRHHVNIRALPIELGEVAASLQPFSELIGMGLDEAPSKPGR
jgi:hypothetical protein